MVEGVWGRLEYIDCWPSVANTEYQIERFQPTTYSGFRFQNRGLLFRLIKMGLPVICPTPTRGNSPFWLSRLDTYYVHS